VLSVKTTELRERSAQPFVLGQQVCHLLPTLIAGLLTLLAQPILGVTGG